MVVHNTSIVYGGAVSVRSNWAPHILNHWFFVVTSRSRIGPSDGGFITPCLLVVCLAAIFAVEFSRLPLVWIISIQFFHVLDYCLNLHWSWVALSHLLGWSFTFCWLSPICSCGIWASRSSNTDFIVSRWQPSFTGPLSPSWYGTSGRWEVLGSTIIPELSRYCWTLIGWIWALFIILVPNLRRKIQLD